MFHRKNYAFLDFTEVYVPFYNGFRKLSHLST